MKNPYEHLYIYNFDRAPKPDRKVGQHPDYLGAWEEDGTAFLFFSRPADGLVDRLVSKDPGLHLEARYDMTCEQWHGEGIHPYRVDRLCISPPWESPDPSLLKDDTTPVLLDPGVVFGTGRHQTTEDCLALICRLLSKESTKGAINRIVDIGTGTGLLSLGAAALGASQVLACDFNLLAVQTTLKNIRLNQFEDRVLAFQARGEQMTAIPCDLLVANIHYDIMQHIIAHPQFCATPWFILSGLLNSEARKVLDFLKTRPVHIVERRCPDGVWNTIFGRRL